MSLREKIEQTVQRKELLRFQKVTLPAGASELVTFEFSTKDRSGLL